MNQDKKIQVVWKPVLGYEDYYEISNEGEVRSLNRTVITTNRNSYLRKGKVMSKIQDKFGYLSVGLTLNSKTKLIKIHRLVALAFISNPENKLTVNHKDGNKLNNNVDNLEWSTYSENSKHAFDNGLNNILDRRYSETKENNPNSKLTQEQVKEIRNKYVPYTCSAKKLANEYGVSQSCIEHILNNRSWKENN